MAQQGYSRNQWVPREMVDGKGIMEKLVSSLSRQRDNGDSHVRGHWQMKLQLRDLWNLCPFFFLGDFELSFRILLLSTAIPSFPSRCPDQRRKRSSPSPKHSRISRMLWLWSWWWWGEEPEYHKTLLRFPCVRLSAMWCSFNFHLHDTPMVVVYMRLLFWGWGKEHSVLT